MARRSIEVAASHLDQSAGTIGQRFSEGVQTADWQSKAASTESEANFATAMQAAIADRARQRGVERVSNESWRQAAISKGAGIIGARVKASISKYRANFAPVLSAMNQAAESAPPRTLNWQENIQARLFPVVEAAKANSKRAR